MQAIPEMNYTRHAKIRMQQRSVPPLVVEWLADYGACRYDHRGAEVHFFDKKARKALSREVGPQLIKQLSKYLNAYMVSDGDAKVITVGYRTKKVGH